MLLVYRLLLLLEYCVLLRCLLFFEVLRLYLRWLCPYGVLRLL